MFFVGKKNLLATRKAPKPGQLVNWKPLKGYILYITNYSTMNYRVNFGSTLGQLWVNWGQLG